MRKYQLAIALCLCLAIACSKPEGAASFTHIISKPVSRRAIHPGLFHADSLLNFNRRKLMEVFGDENIVDKEPASFFHRDIDHVIVLFPFSIKQVELVMSDSTVYADVMAVIIRQNSVWTTRSGIHPDMRLRDLEALNGKSFLFYGGGWDQGGLITNWNRGALDGAVSTCRLDRNYIMPYDLSKGDYDVHEFSSSAREAQMGNPIVEEIILTDEIRL